MLPACAVLARLGPVTPASPPPTRPWRPASPPPRVLPLQDRQRGKAKYKLVCDQYNELKAKYYRQMKELKKGKRQLDELQRETQGGGGGGGGQQRQYVDSDSMDDCSADSDSNHEGEPVVKVKEEGEEGEEVGAGASGRPALTAHAIPGAAAAVAAVAAAQVSPGSNGGRLTMWQLEPEAGGTAGAVPVAMEAPGFAARLSAQRSGVSCLLKDPPQQQQQQAREASPELPPPVAAAAAQAAEEQWVGSEEDAGDVTQAVPPPVPGYIICTQQPPPPRQQQQQPGQQASVTSAQMVPPPSRKRQRPVMAEQLQEQQQQQQQRQQQQQQQRQQQQRLDGRPGGGWKQAVRGSSRAHSAFELGPRDVAAAAAAAPQCPGLPQGIAAGGRSGGAPPGGVQQQLRPLVEANGGGGGGGTGEGAPPLHPLPAYKYQAVVRKRDERERLQAVECPECRGFYDATLSWGTLGLPPACTHMQQQQQQQAPSGGGPGAAAEGAGAGGVSRDALRQEAGRHRYVYQPPSTPVGYWNMVRMLLLLLLPLPLFAPHGPACWDCKKHGHCCCQASSDATGFSASHCRI